MEGHVVDCAFRWIPANLTGERLRSFQTKEVFGVAPSKRFVMQDVRTLITSEEPHVLSFFLH